jgi:protein SCO1/2
VRRPPRQLGFVLIAAAIGTVIGLLAALLRHGSESPAAQASFLKAQVTWAAGAKPSPPVALRDQSGQTVSLRSLHGHVVLLTFLDSKCKSACPIEGRALRNVLQRVRATGAVPVVVSVDPWADTPASARAFAAHAEWAGNWHWLLGSRAKLAPVWRAYDVGVKRTPGDILHTVVLYVIDPRGDLRAGYLFPFPARAVAETVQQLAAGT